MTRQAHNEMLQLAEDLLELSNDSHEEKDVWTFIWGHHVYSVSKFYHHHIKSIRPPITMLWIWKSKCIPRIKFFSWLLLNDRLNTRNMLRRKKYLENYNCVMGQCNTKETLEHLFFECPSAAAWWFSLGIVWNEEAQIQHKIILARNAFPFPFFMEIFMVAAWCLWNERNAIIFNRRMPSVSSCKISFKQEIILHLHRIRPNLHSAIRLWLDSL
jgi:hypothetical protein